MALSVIMNMLGVDFGVALGVTLQRLRQDFCWIGSIRSLLSIGCISNEASWNEEVRPEKGKL